MDTIVKKISNYIKDDRNISNSVVRYIFNYKYKKNAFIGHLVDYEDCKGKLLIKESSYSSVAPVTHQYENPKITVSITPNIKLFTLKDALVHADSSCILNKSKILVTRYDDERYNEGFIKVHNRKFAKVIYNKIEHVEEGLFLGGNGSWNWYHYMIEILPKLLLLEEKPSTILINDVVLQYPTMMEALQLILAENCNIVYLKRDRSYLVKNLIYINDFNHLQFNRFDKQILAKGTYFNEGILQKFSDTLIKSAEPLSDNPNKIFLYRKNTHRVARNQEEIKRFLENDGFTSVCLEEFDLKQQVSLFYQAQFIVGISGAAWTNLIFCRNRPKAICFIPDNGKQFSAFSTLAKIFNVEFYANFYATKIESDHISNDFEIDFTKFKKLYTQIDG